MFLNTARIVFFIILPFLPNPLLKLGCDIVRFLKKENKNTNKKIPSKKPWDKDRRTTKVVNCCLESSSVSYYLLLSLSLSLSLSLPLCFCGANATEKKIQAKKLSGYIYSLLGEGC